MSIESDAKIRELERRVAELEKVVLRMAAGLPLDGSIPRPTLTLPEKRKSA